MSSRELWSSRALLGAVFGLLLLLGWRQVDSLDVGFHLSAGEQILDGRGWPHHDTFTYAVNDHAYTDTSWGYQVLLAGLHRAGGPHALALFHVSLLALIFATVAWTMGAAGAGGATLNGYLLLGILAAEMRFAVRPEFVSYVLFAVVLAVLHQHSRAGRAPLFLLPLAHLIWVNVHSLFVLGWIAVGAFTVEALLRRRADRRFLLWAAACVPVTLVNPYGLQGALFPFTLLTRMQESNVFRNTIGEFVSPFDLGLSARYPFHPELSVFAFRALALLAIVAALRLLARRRIAPLLLIAATLLLSAKMVRNIPILVVAALPFAAWALPLERLLERRLPGLRLRALVPAGVLAALLVAGLGLRVVHDAHYVDDRRPERFGGGWNREVLPAALADWVRRAEPEGRMLNHLNFGGYLHWALQRPVYIDGRLEVMGERFFEHYRRVTESDEALEAEVRRHGIGWMVFPYRDFPRLLGRLSRNPGWRLAYVDAVGVVFTRRGGAREAPVPQHHGWFDDLYEEGSVARLPGVDGRPRAGRWARRSAGLVRRVEFPGEESARGLFHLYRGDNSRAAAALVAAIERSDGAYYELYSNLGAALWRMGRRDEAAACYRVVLTDRPDNQVALRRLDSG